MILSTSSRRGFLTRMGGCAAATMFAPLALGLSTAAAQSGSDYRALVCLNLGGGNDHLSTYVPYDAESYAAYARLRGGLSLSHDGLLALGASGDQGGRQIGLSPNLGGLKTLYDARRLAVVAGVGTLAAPTTRADVDAGRATLPRLLFSHLDQMLQWQSLAPETDIGWGGRFGDRIASANARSNLTMISATGGTSAYLNGLATNMFVIGETGDVNTVAASGDVFDHVVTRSADRTNLLERAYAQTFETLRDGAADLQGTLLDAGRFGPVPGGGLNSTAYQLLAAARVIGAHAALGITRQIFFVNLDGFDTHDGQLDRHPVLMTRLNDALVYFDTMMGQLGLRDNVTLFTMSEFGRTLVANNDGTDHGWGSHHLVMGGAVRGGDIYGRLPVIDPAGPDFLGGGQMLPGIAAEQYAATLGAWMGFSPSDLTTIFSGLSRFGTPNLGFLA